MSKNTLTMRLMASLENENVESERDLDALPKVTEPVPDGADVQLPVVDDSSVVAGAIEPETPTEPVVAPEVSVEELDNTDSLGGGGPVTHQELEEHLVQDEAEHQVLQQEIDEVKDLVDADAAARSVTSTLTTMENLSSADVVFANIALEQIASQVSVEAAVPHLEVVFGRVSKPSMEGLNNWLDKVSSKAKTVEADIAKRRELGRLRSEKQ